MSGLNQERFWRYLLGAGVLHAVLLAGMLSIPLPAPTVPQPKPVELVWLELPTMPPAQMTDPSETPPPPRASSTPRAARPLEHTRATPSSPAQTTALPFQPLTGPGGLADPAQAPAGEGPLSHDQLFPSTLEGLGLQAPGSAGGGSGQPGAGSAGGLPARTRGLLDAEGVRALILQDARSTQARIRADRALHSKTLRDYGTRMEAQWEVRLEDVQRWPTRPEIKLAHPGPESMRDFKREGWTGLDISDPCTYERHSLGWVRLSLNAKGQLLKRELVRTSGSRRLDNEVLRLVDRSAPFDPPEAQDLGHDGLSRSTWDVGIRDYSRSACFTPGQKPLVKDIILVAIEP